MNIGIYNIYVINILVYMRKGEPNVIFVMENTSKYIAFNYIVVYIHIMLCIYVNISKSFGI